jgi:hypothetical protein
VPCSRGPTIRSSEGASTPRWVETDLGVCRAPSPLEQWQASGRRSKVGVEGSNHDVRAEKSRYRQRPWRSSDRQTPPAVRLDFRCPHSRGIRRRHAHRRGVDFPPGQRVRSGPVPTIRRYPARRHSAGLVMSTPAVAAAVFGFRARRHGASTGIIPASSASSSSRAGSSQIPCRGS